MSNNPPEVLIGLSLADAEMLFEDSNEGIIQLLGVLQLASNRPKVSREHLDKIVTLMEFKKRLKEAVEKGIKE